MTIKPDSSPDKSFRILLGIGIFTFLICLLGYSYIGFFTRYATDDFCNLRDLERYGWLGFQINLYLSWSGRFSAAFFTALLNVAGDWLVVVLPGAILLVWVLCLTWCAYQYIKLLNTKYSFLVSLFIALLMVTAIVQTSPSLESTLFWHVGLITYFFPLILLTLFAGITGYALNTGQHGTLLVILGFSLAFVAGGHSETSLVGQVLALGFSLLFVYVKRRVIPNDKVVTKILWAGLIGSCIAFVIVRLAPGNLARQGYFPDPQIIPAFLKSNVYVVYLFFRPLMGMIEKPALVFAAQAAPAYVSGLERALSRSTSPIILIIVILFFALLGYRQESNGIISFKKFIWYLVVLFIAFYVMILSTIFPSQYVMSMFPPLRAVMISQSMIVIFFLFFGFLLGWAMQSRIKLIQKGNQTKIYKITIWVVGILLVFNLYICLAQIVKKAPEFQKYAQDYDQVMVQIENAKEAGQTELEIPLLNKPLFNDYISFDEVNLPIDFCANEYFNMDITVPDKD
ncbi:MAG: hypothetical protein IAF02_14435 [Anaerolineae bacterium]|nr:hypothetical protein [Anaerolineae bacterium]